MRKELHAVTCKYGKVQDMTNFKTMRKMNVISISNKEKAVWFDWAKERP
jgi:septum formation topological specificity factor MinE